MHSENKPILKDPALAKPETTIGLIDCLRIENEGQESHRLQNITDDEWIPIFEEAKAHGLAPYLHWRIKQIPAGPSLPPHLQQQCHQAAIKNAQRNLLIYHQLSEALTWLAKAHIPAIVLKGAYLAEQIYENIALRPMADLDILVPHQRLELAADIFLQHGYHTARSFRVEREVKFHHHLPAFTRPNHFPIEVHWSILHPTFPVDLSGLWSRARATTIAGTRTLALAPEDLVIHLCVHLFYPRLDFGLRPLLDIANVLAHFEQAIDWNLLAKHARDWKVTKHVYLALSLSHQLLNAPVSQATLKSMQPEDYFPAIGQAAVLQVLDPSAKPKLPPNLAALWSRQPLHVSINAAIRRIFLKPDILKKFYALPKDSKNIYFYYPVRIIELLRKYSRQFWRLITRQENILQQARQETLITDWLNLP